MKIMNNKFLINSFGTRNVFVAIDPAIAAHLNIPVTLQAQTERSKKEGIEPWSTKTKMLVGLGVIAAIAISFTVWKIGAEYLNSVAPKTRRIMLGTVYDNQGNLFRDAVTEQVNANHAEYAKRWGLDHRVMNGNLVANKCRDPKQSMKLTDCSPYWNKIEALRQWFKEPGTAGVEEWRILADDDMVITNFQIDPNHGIDALRGGVDASVIITRDTLNWQRWRGLAGRDPKFSVNTGLVILRKDVEAEAFVQKIWQHRHDVVDLNNSWCPNLGTCRNQDSLHEQEATAKVLHDHPQWIDRVVAIVKQRDPNSSTRSAIALNTFARSGRFVRKEAGWSSAPFSYDSADNAENADGSWRVGDWMGQPAGVPLLGKEWPKGNSPIPKPPYQYEPVRLNRIKRLIQSIVF
ncbi:MAG: hypothetical protein HY861_00340 [Chlamydiia bacterium]|nr:hypothetical protein [Chlamydiia bacterium]